LILSQIYDDAAIPPPLLQQPSGGRDDVSDIRHRVDHSTGDNT